MNPGTRRGLQAHYLYNAPSLPEIDHSHKTPATSCVTVVIQTLDLKLRDGGGLL